MELGRDADNVLANVRLGLWREPRRTPVWQRPLPDIPHRAATPLCPRLGLILNHVPNLRVRLQLGRAPRSAHSSHTLFVSVFTLSIINHITTSINHPTTIHTP